MTRSRSETEDWLGLAHRKVLIVGAGAFGAACTDGFLGQRASVMIADYDEEALHECEHRAQLRRTESAHPPAATSTADPASADATNLATYRTDIRSPDRCAKLIEVAHERLGGLDVLVHAVGINRRHLLGDTSDEDWADVLTTNLSSAFWLARASMKLLRASDNAKMVFFSSVSAYLAHPKHGAYAASKAGLNQLVKVLAMELAEDQVHVNAVAPGYVETGLTSDYLAAPGIRYGLVSQVPMGRLGAVDDVVGPVLFLASRRSDFLTGQALIIDGGRSLD